MKLALLGRGRMGQEVTRLAREMGHEITVAIDGACPLGAGPIPRGLEDVDAAIDFTRPDAVPGNVRRLTEAGVPIVVGTTGWYEHLDEVTAAVEVHGVGLVYGSNFSIGANVVLRVVAETARVLNRFPEYDAYCFEHHHRHKVDTPSGTALRLAAAIVDAGGSKERVETARSETAGEAIDASSLHVVGVRAGSTIGRHVVGFDGPADTIEITHTAKSREGFARGALFAAEWIQDRRGTFEFLELFEGRLT